MVNNNGALVVIRLHAILRVLTNCVEGAVMQLQGEECTLAFSRND